MKYSVITNHKSITGENPLWDWKRKIFYWVDIHGKKLFKYDLASNESSIVFEGELIGGFTVQIDGSLLLFMDKGRIALLKEGSLHNLVTKIEIEESEGNRFNDVSADPEGRVFCGTMSDKTYKGRLYRLDHNGDLKVILEDVDLSNGIGYSLDLKYMYYTESAAKTIFRYSYDRINGEITDKKVFLHTPEEKGIQDGLTVDAEGYIWSARYDGGALFRYSSTGEINMKIKVPTSKVTSLAFAGNDFDQIFVTTAGAEDPKLNGSEAGSLYHMQLGIKGKPEFYSAIVV